jgi:predicted PolB exonuclease-like 3'-5' exonuclease
MQVIIDIETVSTGGSNPPVLPPMPILNDVKVGNRGADKADEYRKEQLPSLIEAWSNDCDELLLKADKAWRRESLIPHKCQMVCWALTTDGEVLRSGCDKDISEFKLLEIMSLTLPELVHSPYEITWVGANIRNFDLVILKQRAWKYGFDWLARAFSQTQVFDLIDVFTGSRSKDYLVGKDEMCKFFGIENGDDVDGSQVQDLYDAGQYDKIVQHCVADV